MKQMLISAASSNSGKTLFTIGLLRALRHRGLNVQPFKCGPDYIDPLFHRIASGSTSVNLDLFMGGEQHVQELFRHHSSQADISVVEGVMGLYDGYDKDKGSSAALAELLDLPVILLVNAHSTAYSVAPLIHGFRTFRPQIHIAGVVMNKVASATHYRFLRDACLDAGVPCLGYLLRQPQFVIPERHLGLCFEEREKMDQLAELAAKEIETNVNLEQILTA